MKQQLQAALEAMKVLGEFDPCKPMSALTFANRSRVCAPDADKGEKASPEFTRMLFEYT